MALTFSCHHKSRDHLSRNMWIVKVGPLKSVLYIASKNLFTTNGRYNKENKINTVYDTQKVYRS